MPFNTQAPWTVTNFRDVSGDHVLDTEYTNNTGKTMFVIMALNHIITVAGGHAYVSVNSPNGVQVVAMAGIWTGALNQAHFSSVIFVVQPGNNYYVSSNTANGTNNINTWYEVF